MTDVEQDGATRFGDEQPTGADRIRMVARQLTEPRTVSWVATEADCSHEPTKRVLERLEAEGFLTRAETGTHVTYYPDHRWLVVQEALRLRDSDMTVEDLTERLAELNGQVRDWERTFEVETPNQLRVTIADADLRSEEVDRRRFIAREWEHFQRRIRILEFVLREWEFLAPPTDSPEGSG